MAVGQTNRMTGVWNQISVNMKKYVHLCAIPFVQVVQVESKIMSEQKKLTKFHSVIHRLLHNYLQVQDIPDGHHAPVPLVTRLSGTRSVDTQTPSEETPPSVVASRPNSVSPASAGTSVHCATDSRCDSVESKSSKGWGFFLCWIMLKIFWIFVFS